MPDSCSSVYRRKPLTAKSSRLPELFAKFVPFLTKKWPNARELEKEPRAFGCSVWVGVRPTVGVQYVVMVGDRGADMGLGW
ncbi:hypothetical protein KIMH_01290 [Bombiscardovia apis]|uniref:Transposase n=1 Tax=Bombiscardovia apis TaxID=2932182 RepID=A0ABN6SFJ4_9BIFI|nr:hypothetical protein KIMH_01290 [Bombiscardovia apis]